MKTDDIKLDLQFFGEGDPEPTPAPEPTPEPAPEPEPKSEPEEKTFSQDEVNKIVKDRLKREEKKKEDEIIENSKTLEQKLTDQKTEIDSMKFKSEFNESLLDKNINLDKKSSLLKLVKLEMTGDISLEEAMEKVIKEFPDFQTKEIDNKSRKVNTDPGKVNLDGKGGGLTQEEIDMFNR